MAATKTYYVTVELESGSWVTLAVEANNQAHARSVALSTLTVDADIPVKAKFLHILEQGD